MRFDARARAVGLGLIASLVVVQPVQAGPVVPAPVVPAPGVPAPVMSAAAPGVQVSSAAETAYREGQASLQSAKYTEAVKKLDEAIELAPRWSAPVQLRAQAFAALAEMHAPSEAFLTAQAADVELLLTLEPGVETATRQQQLITLRTEAAEARKKETRRRKLNKPAIVYIVANATMLISGALMTSFHASEKSLDAYGVKRYVYTGAVMLGIGAAMIPGSIALGLLAGRQTKRDSAVADFNVETGRRGPQLGLAPQFVPGGGGMGLSLRF